ncbi:MAG TPA: CBS domain-containing protein, partial [Acidimicrobiales bacterium]
MVSRQSAATTPQALTPAERVVEDVMTPLDDIPMVDASDDVVDVVERLNGTNVTGQVVVVDEGCVVGILDEFDVAGALDRAD